MAVKTKKKAVRVNPGMKPRLPVVVEVVRPERLLEAEDSRPLVEVAHGMKNIDKARKWCSHIRGPGYVITSGDKGHSVWMRHAGHDDPDQRGPTKEALAEGAAVLTAVHAYCWKADD